MGHGTLLRAADRGLAAKPNSRPVGASREPGVLACVRTGSLICTHRVALLYMEHIWTSAFRLGSLLFHIQHSPHIVF